MAITAIGRYFQISPNIVGVITTDDLTEITTAGYLTTQEDEIEALNAGEFEWAETDLFLIFYDGGIAFFTRNATTNAFVANPAAAGVSATLASSQILVGNASNVATAVAMTGDVAINDAGLTTIQPASIDLAMLSAGVAPSHVIKFANQVTTVGGAAAEAFVVTGAVAATDRAFVQVVNDGTANVTVLQAVVTANTLTVTFSANPGADTVINYQIIRAAA